MKKNGVGNKTSQFPVFSLYMRNIKQNNNLIFGIMDKENVQFEEVDNKEKKSKGGLLRVIGRNIINRYKEKPSRLLYDTLKVGGGVALGVYVGKKIEKKNTVKVATMAFIAGREEGCIKGVAASVINHSNKLTEEQKNEYFREAKCNRPAFEKDEVVSKEKLANGQNPLLL